MLLTERGMKSSNLDCFQYLHKTPEGHNRWQYALCYKVS